MEYGKEHTLRVIFELSKSVIQEGPGSEKKLTENAHRFLGKNNIKVIQEDDRNINFVVLDIRDIRAGFNKDDYTEQELRYIEFCRRFHEEPGFENEFRKNPSKVILAEDVGDTNYVNGKQINIFVDSDEVRHINIPWPFIRSFDSNLSVNDIINQIANTVSGHVPGSTGTTTASVGTCKR